VIDPIKEFLKIQIYYPTMAPSDVLLRLGHCLRRRAFWPEPVAVFGEGGVPSVLPNLHHRLLNESIQHRRETMLGTQQKGRAGACPHLGFDFSGCVALRAGALGEARHGLRFGVEHFKHRQQLGDLQHFLELAAQVAKPQ